MELNNIVKEIEKRLSPSRFSHVMSVASFAKEVARANNIDEDDAYLAGILHDVAKCYDDNTLKEKYIIPYLPEYLSYPSFSYHAYVGAYIAKNEFDIEDENILKAIANHCLVTLSMGRLEKLIYLSDKVEPTRKFKDVFDDVRKMCYVDIDKAFIMLLEKQNEYLLKSNRKVDESLLKAIEYYKKEEKNER